jgi:hypothetical protein
MHTTIGNRYCRQETGDKYYEIMTLFSEFFSGVGVESYESKRSNYE